MKTLKELIAYKSMIGSLIQRDLRGRYKGSVLGFAWTFLNPLLQLCVYTVVFSAIMRAGIEDYYLFLFVALIPWIFFSSSLTGGASCIFSQKELVKKIYFPREVLPISYVTSCFVNMLLSFLVVFALIAVSGSGFCPQALACLPIVMLTEYVLCLGIALIVSACTVYLRDLEHMIGVLLMAWIYLTPVMYDIRFIPKDLFYLFYMNPMTPIAAAYREILYYKQIPDLSGLVACLLFALSAVCAGLVIFTGLQKNFVEEL